MINHSEAFAAAITADARRVLLRAMINIIDPDITYENGTGSAATAWSKANQLYDKSFKTDAQYATLEPGRWLLDGSCALIPNDNNVAGQVGYVSDALCNEQGYFSSPQWAQINFSRVSILQAFSVFFSTDKADGVPSDFTVEVYSGETAYFAKSFTENSETSVALTGFTVYNPDAVRITVTRWSIPGRRMRIPEILPGVYEEWNSDIIASFDVVQQGSISCLYLPYGTCTLRMDNLDRRFEPRSKTGIFQSIEERQGINISIGVKTETGEPEYKPVGIYFQANGGWKTGDNGITMQWNLVDIIGLISDRSYIVPDTLPTTLDGWVSSIVAQLGDNFSGWWHVDPNYANVSCVANSKEDVADRKCGEILRYACMATGTWPRADAETGYLTVEPLWSQGNKMDLDNLNAYPVIKANDDIAALIFTLYDGNKTEYVISGTSASSSNTATIKNPFIHSKDAALTAARQILAAYGGNILQTTGRGNPSSEIGDVDTVWLNESSATTGRRMYQTFSMRDGVMQGCKSNLLQADGSFQFEERVVLTGSGAWTAPAGVTRLRVILGQGGQGGGKGADGVMTHAGGSYEVPTSPGNTNTIPNTTGTPDGKDGVDGRGGKIWYGTININSGQTFQYNCGVGGDPGFVVGAPGAEGGETTFGVYSSSNGALYPLGFTDVASGDSYGRSGVAAPLLGSADGGKRGDGGRNGIEAFGGLNIIYGDPELIPGQGWVPTIVGWETITSTLAQPEKGKNGAKGGDGFVTIYYDKAEVRV